MNHLCLTKWTCWVTLLLTRFRYQTLCLDFEDQEEGALYATEDQDDVFYEEPDLSGGVEGVDYGLVYGAGEESE
jgi:hypothetical protein